MKHDHNHALDADALIELPAGIVEMLVSNAQTAVSRHYSPSELNECVAVARKAVSARLDGTDERGKALARADKLEAERNALRAELEQVRRELEAAKNEIASAQKEETANV